MIYIRNAIVWFVCFLLALPPGWVLAADPIVVDASAPGANQAAVATTPSGKPMLNIAAPNASGVSHNKFTNFNVTAQGLVINNATGLANTSLAGVIEANPKFSGRAASLILNEVTSSNRSVLKGATEIGGQAADYILANPNGITCDGCGFINTPRATLTTGTPTFSGTQLTGLSVDVGDILVEGLGLDATKATKFDIVTRAATINAQINAADLGIHAGRQDFDYAARTGAAKTDDGSAKPVFAIDSTVLGGMYAGRITLVGTEAGLGVRIAGDMAANTGDMVLTADGRLELKSDISAAQDIQLASLSDDIVTDKAVYAGGHLTATAIAGSVTANADASFGAAGDVTVKAANVTTGDGGQFVAGMDDGGALTTSGTLDIQATTKIQTGEGFLGAGQAVKLKAPSIDLSRATDDTSETVRSRGALTIESANVSAANGRVASDGAMALKGNSPIVLGAGLYASTAAINLSGDSVTSAATLVSDDQVNITSTIGDIVNTGSMTAGTSLNLNSTANITNSGILESQTGTTLKAAGDINNQSDAKIKSAQATTVTAGGTLTNAGSIFAQQAATIIAPTITNTGSLAAGTDLNINVGSLTNTGGVLHAQDNIFVFGTDGTSNATLFDNASGFVETVTRNDTNDSADPITHGIFINADTIKNRKSVFVIGSSGGSVSVSLGNRICKQGHSSETAGIEWCATRFSVSSPVGSATVWAKHSEYGGARPYNHISYSSGTVSQDSASGRIASGGNLTFNATTVTNDKSTITAMGGITINAGTLNNQATKLYNELHITNVYSCSQHPVVGWQCTPTSVHRQSSTYTADALIQAGGALTVNATGGVRNGTEVVYAAPTKHAEKVNPTDLTTARTPPALLDTTRYAKLIPGRDALFLATASPAAKFVYETNVDFIDVSNYYGSDYFIGKLGVTPGEVATRLGDAYFDTTLVREAITRETGRRFLDDTVDNDIEQMKNLLDNAVAASGGLDLAFGISLTRAQIDALTTDIVWYVEEQYNGQTVLVPKVFLASATRAKLNDSGAILAGETVTINAASIENDKGVIRADNDIQLTAEGDITSRSGEIAAGGDIALASTDGDVVIETQVDTFQRRSSHGGTNILSTRHATSTVDAGGDLSISAANGNVALRGTEVRAGGDASVNAGGDVTIASQQMQTRNRERRDERGALRVDWFNETNNLNSTVTVDGALDITSGANAKVRGATVSAGGDLNLVATGDVTVESVANTFTALNEQRVEVDNQAAALSAGGDLSVTSGGTARIKGSTLDAQDDLSVQATGDVVIETSADRLDFVHDDLTLKSTTHNRSGLTAGGDVTVGSLIGNLSVISSELESGGDITLNTPGGAVYLGVRKDYYEERETKTKKGLLTQTVINRGRIDETVVPTLMTADGNIAIVTGDGVIVDYKDTGSLNDSIAQLSQSPGLAWMKDLQARSDVDWNAVEEIHHSWDYRSQGISPVGAMMISLAVGVASGGVTAGAEGWGASLFGDQIISMGLKEATAHAVANAGFNTLISQAAIAVVGNGGDLGAALKDLGSIDAIKALATSMVTAGLLEGLEIADTLDIATGKAAPLTDKLQLAIANGAISASVDSVINGAPLTDNLKSALASAAVTVVSQTAFKKVGDLGVEYGLEEGSLQKIAMHALTGCAVGEAGSGGCAAGAMAAGLQEMLGDGFQEITSDPEKQVKLAGLIGALAVAVTGGDVDAVSAAANIAETANAYNRQLHSEEIQAIRKKAEELDGIDGLSAAEWETRLGQAALRRVDLQSAAKFDEDAVADGAIGEIINEYGTQFADSLAASFKFLERDEYYTSSATFSPSLIDPATKGFYDNVYADWATQTYGPDITDKVAPSQLALLNAVAPRFGSACGSHAGCEFLSPEFADVIDPTQARAMNAVILHGMRRQVGEVYEILKAANGTSPQATQAFNDSRRAYIDLTAAEGAQTLLGSRGAIGEAAKDTLSTTANAVQIIVLASSGDKASLKAIGDTVTALVDVLSSPQDIPPAIRASIVEQLNEAQTLYEAGDLQGAGNVAGKLQLTLFGSIKGTTAVAGITDHGAELLRKIGGTEDALKTPAQVWDIPPMQRGNVIEASLAKSDYKDWYHVGEERKGKFPLVDFQNGTTLVSLKTVDTNGSTWFERMSNHIKDLGTRGATVDGQPADMILDLRVQPGGFEAAKELRIIAEKRGVQLIIKEFK